jgi:MoaA/NifB/PqqE/SkfB family radical SAM enzyme
VSIIQKLKQALSATHKPKRPYRLLQIEPSLECSLECVMCPWSELRPPHSTMSRETFDRLMPDLLLAESVDLTGGGEPLINPRLVDMVRAAKAAGCTVGFSTNATRLDADTARGLIDAGLDWISFSVDAASADLYEQIRQGARFDKVMGNIAGLRDLKHSRGSQAPKMMMVFVVMSGAQQNYHELPAFIELAHSLGVEQVIAKNLDVIIKDGDDARRVFSHAGMVEKEVAQAIQAAQQRAQALGVGLRLYALQPQEAIICEHNPLGAVFINWEGKVSPCITLAYAENRVFDGHRVLVPCQQFGDIRSETLQEIWDKPDFRRFRSMYEARLSAERQATLDSFLGGSGEGQMPPAPEECRTCYYLYGI